MMGEKAVSQGPKPHPLLQRLFFIASWLAVLSSLYHISAVYLLPLPAKMHPNMHLLMAFTILLIGGAAASPEIYGEKLRKLGVLPALYAVALMAAVFFFFFLDELGEGWTEARIWWVYALPFLLWGGMMARERAWLALGLWSLGFLPALFLWLNWGSLAESVQAPTSWWFLLLSAVPSSWLLFGIFYRPGEALRRAWVPLVVAFATAALAAWQVARWAGEADETRHFFVLWPLLLLMVPGAWAWRGIRKGFAEFPRFPLPGSLVMGRDLGLLLLAVGACSYIFFTYEELVDRVGAPNFADTRTGFVLIAVPLELTRRCFGPALPTLSLAAIAYGMWGNLFAPPIGHGGATWIELTRKISTDFIGGVLGFLVIISATFIIMFIIFGAFLHESGAGRFFVDFCLGLFGRMRAGPGLAAVGSSALMGSVSGSASANVITTGTFTIPLMKRMGLSPHLAAATEVAASTGGQIMPPVMSAGAFIMAELIETPYLEIIKYAAIPAIIYFFIVGFNVHFAAGQLRLRRLPKDEIPSLKAELWHGWFYLVPLVFLVYYLIEGRTPVFAGATAVFLTVLLWFYRLSAPFLGTLRTGERDVSDENYMFAPLAFWVYLASLYFLLSLAEEGLGLPLGLAAPPSWEGAAGAGVLFAAAGAGLGALLVWRFPAVAAYWREIERGWLFIYPAGAFLLWWLMGWEAGVAGAFLALGALGLWAAARRVGFETFALVPWTLVLIGLAAFGVQQGMYALLPVLSDLASYVRPFGFLYHAGVFFALTTLIQRFIWALRRERPAEDASPPGPLDVAAVVCNPLASLRRARSGERGTRDAEMAEGCLDWLNAVRRALVEGGKRGAEFGVILAAIEVVSQVFTITGVGNKISMLIEALSQDICLIGIQAGGGCLYGLGLDGFFVMLLLNGIACTILGMGMPTTAAYIFLAVLGGPALIKLVGPEMVAIHGAEWTKGFIAANGDRIAAHMFIFYFSILSVITPPVAIASIVGAKIAEAPFLKTCVTAIRFAIVGFVVPFLFMYQPAILGLDRPVMVVSTLLLTLLAFVAFAAGTQGYFLRDTDWPDRALLIACSVFLLFFVVLFHWVLLLTGLLLFGVALARQIRKVKASPEVEPAQPESAMVH